MFSPILFKRGTYTPKNENTDVEQRLELIISCLLQLLNSQLLYRYNCHTITRAGNRTISKRSLGYWHFPKKISIYDHPLYVQFA